MVWYWSGGSRVDGGLSGNAVVAAEGGGDGDPRGDMVTLDVGGTRMRVQRQVLTQFPDSRLATLFSGRWDDGDDNNKNCVIAEANDGRFFMDVSMKIFEPLVDMLRMRFYHPESGPKFVTMQDLGGNEWDYQRFLTLLDYYGVAEALYPCVLPIQVFGYGVDRHGNRLRDGELWSEYTEDFRRLSDHGFTFGATKNKKFRLELDPQRIGTHVWKVVSLESDVIEIETFQVTNDDDHDFHDPTDPWFLVSWGRSNGHPMFFSKTGKGSQHCE